MASVPERIEALELRLAEVEASLESLLALLRRPSDSPQPSGPEHVPPAAAPEPLEGTGATEAASPPQEPTPATRRGPGRPKKDT